MGSTPEDRNRAKIAARTQQREGFVSEAGQEGPGVSKTSEPKWEGLESAVARTAESVSQEMLGAYREAPRLVQEHYNLEIATVEYGYGQRQLFELVQNGADELLDQHGRIQVVLTDKALYCANEGSPLSVEGIRALQYSHLSAKKGTEIGRFGLGFKSVLGVTRTPEIFSRSGSVLFDPDHARTVIGEATGKTVKQAPTLRIGIPVDPEKARKEDKVLAELMSWATTVVRLHRDRDETDWLHSDVLAFPAEFLLFSPHVAELVLEDRTAKVKRTITVRVTDDESCVLHEGNQESTWSVFRENHKLSDRARADAGRHSDRKVIPLAWAVPVSVQRRRKGEFWAFFPVGERTTLSGILNAPWKLNESRTGLIKGVFNQELLQASTELVMERLQEIPGTDDPGLVLDLLPGRGREILGWADEVTTEAINKNVGRFPCVPDQNGELDAVGRLKIHPAGVSREALDLWHATPGRPTDWAHPSIETRERRPRVDMYMDNTGAEPESIETWLEALLNRDAKAGSAQAILCAAEALGAEDGTYDRAIRRARILLTEDGRRRPLDEDGIFLRAPLPLEVNVRYVDPEVAAQPGVAAALERLGIHPVEPILLLKTLLRAQLDGWTDKRWDLFWELARQAPALEVKEALDAERIGRSRLKVRTLAGSYTRLVGALLPGAIASQTGEEDRACVIDTAFHRGESELLRALDATAAPEPEGGGADEPWFAEYEQEALSQYLAELKRSGAAPNSEYLGFQEEERPFPGPLTPLRSLSRGARGRYVAALLGVVKDLKPWTFSHATQSRYPPRKFPHPVVWMTQRHGMLETSLGLLPVEQAVGPQLAPLRAVLPVTEIQPQIAEALGLPSKLENLTPTAWEAMFKRVEGLEDERLIGLTYLAAARNGVPRPDYLRCRIGTTFELAPAEGVAVTADEQLARDLQSTSHPHIRTLKQDETDALIQDWGLLPATDSVRREVSCTPAGESEPLVDAYPQLRLYLDDAQRELQIVPCTDLQVETVTDTGTLTEPKEIVVQDDGIYVLVALNERDRLGAIAAALGIGLGRADLDRILENVEENRARQLKAKIRKASDDIDRLLLAVGAEALRRRVPKALIEAVEELQGDLDDRGIAELSIVVHGIRVLQEHAEDLEEHGLTPPTRWAGSRRANEFVRSLGFGAEYAGFDSPKPAATLEVEGTPNLGPLHDYQQEIVEEIRRLVRGEDGLRGLLALPTGAGKTRVTIEALVNAMSARELSSPILWVAQTEELCEQAIETWSEIWRAFGPTGRLTISRLYGSYEAEQAEVGEQVVVATVAKLDSGVFEKKQYKWLSKAACLVVDEAHSSIGEQYTRLLEWQDMARRNERVPLIGLTATPFRGTNKQETERLVARYRKRKLDDAAFGELDDPYPLLQEKGILSLVDHDLLPGAEISLSASELAQLEQLRSLPASANRRLGTDVERNRTLLESITTLPDDWPILLYATSVEHAEIMAALLVREGIPAASILGTTNKAARRHYIEQFRSGGIRVLTNYGVLTAGFDAPKVRAVYVARPTYSANLYQQMVGRGLRGPLNGGTDRCLLVNVEDNVAQYGEQLAFHDFDYLWTPDTAVA